MQTVNRWTLLGSLLLSLAPVLAHGQNSGTGSGYHTPRGNFTAAEQRGHGIYLRYCVGCHGVLGDGEGETGPYIDPKPRNFIAATFRCRSTDRDLYKIFMTGLDGTPMPSFADNVKPDEAWDLVFYLRTLQPMHTKAKAIAEQLGLRPINPGAGPGGQAQEKGEGESAPRVSEGALPRASSQAAEVQSASTESKPSVAPDSGSTGAQGNSPNPVVAQSPEVQPTPEAKPAVAAEIGRAHV